MKIRLAFLELCYLPTDRQTDRETERTKVMGMILPRFFVETSNVSVKFDMDFLLKVKAKRYTEY
jgi:hypothetical protein